jgi:hypothetical protein
VIRPNGGAFDDVRRRRRPERHRGEREAREPPRPGAPACTSRRGSDHPIKLTRRPPP